MHKVHQLIEFGISISWNYRIINHIYAKVTNTYIHMNVFIFNGGLFKKKN